jgi:hypothetical protein
VITPAPLWLGQSALAAGAAALTGVYVPLWRRQREDSVLVQAFGAVLATAGALLWLGGMPVARLLPWLAGFVVLTIAGERLELARVTLLATGTVSRLLGLAALITLGTVLTLLWPTLGYPVLGLSLLALVWWLMVHDVARRTIRANGLPRFMAGCLLVGYGWLAVAGALWTLFGQVTDGPAYDAVIHAVFLGFTMSMIMAHAPVILPAVLRCRLPYHPVMIGPPVLLHISLVLRLCVGDAHGVAVARQIGGALNVLALLAFAAIMAGSAIRAGRRRPSGPCRSGRSGSGPSRSGRSGKDSVPALPSAVPVPQPASFTSLSAVPAPLSDAITSSAVISS